MESVTWNNWDTDRACGWIVESVTGKYGIQKQFAADFWKVIHGAFRLQFAAGFVEGVTWKIWDTEAAFACFPGRYYMKYSKYFISDF